MTKTNDILLIRPDGSGYEMLYPDGSVQKTKEKPLAFLDRRCLLLGSSANGRMESFRTVLGVKQKAAVLVSELKGEIWFPTLSMKAPECVWLNYREILSVSSSGRNTSLVRFFSGMTAEINVDIRTIRLQMKRCRAYLEIISENQKNV